MPKPVAADVREKILLLAKEGKTLADTAEILGVHPSTVYRIRAAAGLGRRAKATNSQAAPQPQRRRTRRHRRPRAKTTAYSTVEGFDDAERDLVLATQNGLIEMQPGGRVALTETGRRLRDLLRRLGPRSP